MKGVDDRHRSVIDHPKGVKIITREKGNGHENDDSQSADTLSRA